MQLPLEIEIEHMLRDAPAPRGRPIEVEVVGPITAEGLARAEAEREVRENPLQRVSERHHALARAFASGKTAVEAAALAGYSTGRARLLRTDPAFMELVALYSAKAEVEYVDMHRRMAALGSDAAEELHDRLEDDPESFTNAQLLEIVKQTADRTGFGPSSSQTNINVNMDLAEKLKLARERARPKVIEGTAVEVNE